MSEICPYQVRNTSDLLFTDFEGTVIKPDIPESGGCITPGVNGARLGRCMFPGNEADCLARTRGIFGNDTVLHQDRIRRETVDESLARRRAHARIDIYENPGHQSIEQHERELI